MTKILKKKKWIKNKLTANIGVVVVCVCEHIYFVLSMITRRHNTDNREVCVNRFPICIPIITMTTIKCHFYRKTRKSVETQLPLF